MIDFLTLDNGSVAAIFAVAVAIATDWSAPLQRHPAQRRLALGLGPTINDWEPVSAEARINLVAPIAFGKLQPMLDLSVSHKGAAYAGLGVYADAPFSLGGQPFYVAGSVVAGLYLPGGDIELDLPLQFRSTLEAGVELGGDVRIGVAWDHRSSAALADGPLTGLESAQLRLTIPF